MYGVNFSRDHLSGNRVVFLFLPLCGKVHEKEKRGVQSVVATQTFGLLSLGFCLFMFLLAFCLHRLGRTRLALALIVLGGLALRIQSGSDMFLHGWDERYHALVAKNLIKHPLVPTLYDDPALPYDYRSWDANHVWLHKQPVPLWAMALSMRTFGVNEIALRSPSILLSTLAIGLTYSIGSMLFTVRVALRCTRSTG
jgi:hypothetical protein